MTITPTVIHGGIKENVIPSECETVFDIRILPGQTTSQALNMIKKLLKRAGIEKLTFEIIQAFEPSQSDVNTPFYHAISEVMNEFEPRTKVVPMLMTAGTDSRFFRAAGSICYGFHPMRPEIESGRIIKREHGVDERISIQNLVFGISALYEIVKRLMT